METVCEAALARQWADAVTTCAHLANVTNEYAVASGDALQRASAVIDILRSHADNNLAPRSGHDFADLTPNVSVPNFEIAAPNADVSECEGAGVDCSGITAAACVTSWRRKYTRAQLVYARLHANATAYSAHVVRALQDASQVYTVFVASVDVAFYRFGGFRV